MKRLRSLVLALAPVGCGAVSLHAPPAIPMHATAPLRAEAKAIHDREGFVLVSPAKEQLSSFHLGYSALFRGHQPVYVTADALLHAWHASYDDILASLEHAALAPATSAMLAELRATLAKKTDAEPTARADVARYLDVASSLVSGVPATGEASSIVAEIEAASGAGSLELFGTTMDFDFSMMKPRGHYTRTVELQRYFRAMSWLGRVELRIAQTDANGRLRLDRRVLSAVSLLRSLFTASSERTWRQIDEAIGAFVGPRDSMSLPEYDVAAKALGGTDDAVLAAFAAASKQRIGTQLLRPGHEVAAFVLLGQRYVFDSHVFSRVTYGGLRTKRMMPTPLDVGYTVFGSTTAKALLAPEVSAYGGEYAQALETMVSERKAAGAALFEGSIHHRWLGALAELSPDAERDAVLPAPFRGEAWARRLLGTQLASWAELRHDNLLYAKQSVTAYALCDYPHGYVEPYPRFFAALEQMASSARATIEKLPLGGAHRTRIATFLSRYAEVAARLRAMAERERRDEPLDADDLDFLNHMVSIDGRHAGCTTIVTAEGWYADLFFDRDRALRHDPVVADVHTQPTDEDGNMVGKVLHVGTGYPRLLVVTIAHDGGQHPRTYRGFVSTYAETTTRDFRRLDDESWRTAVHEEHPVPPPWLKDVVAE